MLEIPDAAALDLIGGRSVVAYGERGSVTEGDELAVGAASSALGIVVGVHPAQLLPDSTESDGRDLLIVRVYVDGEPVLGDDEFYAMRAAVEGALTG